MLNRLKLAMLGEFTPRKSNQQLLRVNVLFPLESSLLNINQHTPGEQTHCFQFMNIATLYGNTAPVGSPGLWLEKGPILQYISSASIV